METVKVLAKGQIVIPAAIRKKHKIKPGSALQLFEYGNLLYLVPPVEDPVKQARGCLPSLPSLSDELRKDHDADK